MIPVLNQDGSSLDWKCAAYHVVVEVNDVGAVVTHKLSKAPELIGLIEVGAAGYAVEVRCPRTLYARTWVSGEPRLAVSWDDADVDGQIFLFPGVVTLRETSLPTTGLIDLWEEDQVQAPSGAWLARGVEFAAKNLAAALIEFSRNESLEEGRVKVEEDTSGDDGHFLVELAPDLYQRAVRGDRDIQVAGLIAAFAKLPGSSRFDEDSDSPVARMLRARLAEAGVSTWDDSDAWDPAFAATTIERFHPAPGEDKAAP